MSLVSLNSVQFAVNYSHEAVNLADAGEIQFDLCKLPAWPDLVRQVHPKYPGYIHFNLAAGDGSLERVNWAELVELQEYTNTLNCNLHLVAPQGYDLSSKVQYQAALDCIVRDVAFVCQRIGAQRVIVETYPMYSLGREWLLPAVEPSSVNHIVDETGCGFLLDLAHCRLTAATLHMPEQEYISALPVKALRELHIVGVGEVNGVWMDHFPMTPPDWDCLDWSLGKITQGEWRTPEIAALEYGGLGEVFRWRTKAEVLRTEVPAIWRRLKGQVI